MGFFKSLIKRLFADDVLIVNQWFEAGDDQDYRFPDDPSYVIRLNQDWPEGIGAGLFTLAGHLRNGIKVTGISQPQASKNASAFIVGKNRRVELVRDPSNSRDPHAIKVIASWESNDGRRHQGQIGWVPAEFAKEIARLVSPDTPIGATMKLMYRPRPGKSPGVRINIGRPAKRRGRKKKVK